MKNNPKIDKIYAIKLSRVIDEISKKYRIPASLFSAILMQESGYNLSAKNLKCGTDIVDKTYHCIITDYGISQVHYKNVSRFKLDSKRLTSDLKYSVESGAKILASYSRFRKVEPSKWWVHYNCGNGSLDKNACRQYQNLVARWM